MRDLLKEISAYEWLFALVVAILVTTASSVLTYLIKNHYERRQSTRDFLIPLFADFVDNKQFRQLDLRYDQQCLPDWIKYLNYTNDKIHEVYRYLCKFDLVIDISGSHLNNEWKQLIDKGLSVAENLMDDIQIKEVNKDETIDSIHELASETIELIGESHEYVFSKVRKFI